MPRKPKSPPEPKRHIRAWHAGTVTALPNGKFRAFRARVHKPDGSNSRPSKMFADRASAESWAAGEVEPDVLLLGHWLNRWLTLRLPTIRPNTQRNYRDYVTASAPIAGLPLATLTTEQLQAHANTLLNAWGRSHVNTWRTTISSALKDATEAGLIPRNPMRGVRLPKPVETPVKAWTAAEVARLIAAAAGRAHETWLWLSIGTGIRLGEALALTWGDVDLIARTIRVSKSRDHHTARIGPTKSGRTRTVDLPDELVTVLVAARARQNAREQHVCVSTYSGRVPTAYAVRTWLLELCRKAGITPLSPHATRHTCASLMISAGVPIPEVARTLGHASPVITMQIYAHAIDAGSRRGATALGAVLVHDSGALRAIGSEIGTSNGR